MSLHCHSDWAKKYAPNCIIYFNNNCKIFPFTDVTPKLVIYDVNLFSGQRLFVNLVQGEVNE